MNENPMHIISLGAGVQSTTLLLMACHGEIRPKPKFAIFADTGWEPPTVYRHLEWLKIEAAKYGISVITVSNGNIKRDLENAVYHGKRVASVPFYVANRDGTVGMARRQCTSEYKIKPVQRKMRELLGYKPRKIIKEKVTLWLGISTDEIQRVKTNREKWIENRYPLIELCMSRLDCLNWLEKKGYPRPPKSSCIGCPYHSDEMWLDMKQNDPESWEEAVEIDRLIKKLPRFEGEAYLHRSCLPLDEVNLGEDQLEFDFDGFANECEGMCGV